MDDDEFDFELRSHDQRHGAGPGADPGRSGWTIGRVLAAAGLAAIAVFWVWAFSPWAPTEHPDELDDRAFAAAAEVRCAEALRVIEAMPAADEAESMRDRGLQIDESTLELDDMLDDLEAMAPDPRTRDGDLVRRWLADWRVFVGNRFDYADDFYAGIDGPFTVSLVRGEQVTAPIDTFATVNGMPSCATPQDV